MNENGNDKVLIKAKKLQKVKRNWCCHQSIKDWRINQWKKLICRQDIKNNYSSKFIWKWVKLVLSSTKSFGWVEKSEGEGEGEKNCVESLKGVKSWNAKAEVTLEMIRKRTGITDRKDTWKTFISRRIRSNE